MSRQTTSGTVEAITFIEGDHWSGGGWYVFKVAGVRHSSTSDKWLGVRRGDRVTFTHGGRSGRVCIRHHERAGAKL